LTSRKPPSTTNDAPVVQPASVLPLRVPRRILVVESGHRCGDHPGSHRVDGDPMSAELERELFRETSETVLGDRVGA
jgi:hypothetical protein